MWPTTFKTLDDKKTHKILEFDRKIGELLEPSEFPIFRDEFYPARYVLVVNTRGTVLPIMIAKDEEDNDEPKNELSELAKKLDLKITEPATGTKYLKYRNKRQWLQPTNERPKKRRRRVSQTQTEEPKTFYDELEVPRNSFVFARSIVHPVLPTSMFTDVTEIMSNLWNDVSFSDASDYFTFLMSCTRISNKKKPKIPLVVNVFDFCEYIPPTGSFSSTAKEQKDP